MPIEQTVYFHGAPGSPAELNLFGLRELNWAAPDRFMDRTSLPFRAYLDALAQELDTRYAPAPLRLIGFSAGARVALELAGRLKGRISRIELISPTAPLELGDFVPRMEGRRVFTLVRDAPGLFPAWTWTMARVGGWFPRQVFKAVFAHPAGADAALAADPAFAAAVTAMLRRSVGDASSGFRREILACVHPWFIDLATVDVPVRIWQGTVDNWTPVDMAQALQALLPNAEPMRLLDGLSHYSALRHTLVEIAAGR